MYSVINTFIFSVAPVIGSVIRITIYQLNFFVSVLDRYHMIEKAADTDICAYLEINDCSYK